MKIERNIPIPVVPVTPRSERVPVESMEIGDSIYFDIPKRAVALAKVRGTAMRAGLRHNYRSASEGPGVRVWRTA